MEKRNVVQEVYVSIMNDDQPSEKQAVLVKDTYMTASDEQKKAIDLIFTHLCGWRMDSLLEKTSQESEWQW